jgi:hypothetical protein
LSALAAVGVIVNCRSSPSSSVTLAGEESKSTAPRAATQREERQKEAQLADIERIDRLPEDYDSRLTAILREAVPDDVIVSFYYMAAAKNPSANYRWELHRDGRLFLVHHSGRNPTYENTFDRPLPKEPTKVLKESDIRALYDQLDQAGFFTQPTLQRVSSAQGGAYVVVRARDGDRVHDVVYQNIENPLIKSFYSIAQ